MVPLNCSFHYLDGFDPGWNSLPAMAGFGKLRIVSNIFGRHWADFGWMVDQKSEYKSQSRVRDAGAGNGAIVSCVCSGIRSMDIRVDTCG